MVRAAGLLAQAVAVLVRVAAALVRIVAALVQVVIAVLIRIVALLRFLWLPSMSRGGTTTGSSRFNAGGSGASMGGRYGGRASFKKMDKKITPSTTRCSDTLNPKLQCCPLWLPSCRLQDLISFCPLAQPSNHMERWGAGVSFFTSGLISPSTYGTMTP